jgi:hypothetical protein
MSYSDVSDPRYEIGEEVYIIPPSDPLHTLRGTIDRQPTPEEPYYIVTSDAAAGKQWSMVASSIAPCENVPVHSRATNTIEDKSRARVPRL